MIISQTLNLLNSSYSARMERLTIAEVRIGISMTAVRLSDGSCGVASTIPNDHHYCKKNERDYSEFTPLKIRGRRVTDLFGTKKINGIITTLRIACLNAISSEIIESGKYKIIENCDPVDLIDLKKVGSVVIVGAFHSYISRIAREGNRLYVLELDENALHDDTKQYYVPAYDFKRVIPFADTVIITGLTLVNDTIDDLLLSIPDGTYVMVVGPSGSIIPDILFANKVDVIGATRIIKPDVLFDLISEGGGGYHLFEYCAQKICILKDHEA